MVRISLHFAELGQSDSVLCAQEIVRKFIAASRVLVGDCASAANVGNTGCERSIKVLLRVTAMGRQRVVGGEREFAVMQERFAEPVRDNPLEFDEASRSCKRCNLKDLGMACPRVVTGCQQSLMHLVPRPMYPSLL